MFFSILHKCIHGVQRVKKFQLYGLEMGLQQGLVCDLSSMGMRLQQDLVCDLSGLGMSGVWYVTSVAWE